MVAGWTIASVVQGVLDFQKAGESWIAGIREHTSDEARSRYEAGAERRRRAVSDNGLGSVAFLISAGRATEISSSNASFW
jgi:hypothetical protein